MWQFFKYAHHSKRSKVVYMIKCRWWYCYSRSIEKLSKARVNDILLLQDLTLQFVFCYKRKSLVWLFVHTVRSRMVNSSSVDCHLERTSISLWPKDMQGHNGKSAQYNLTPYVLLANCNNILLVLIMLWWIMPVIFSI